MARQSMKILKTKKYSILSTILKYSFVIVFTVMLTMPVLFVNAEGGTGDDGGGTGTNITTKINNPLGENGPKDIPEFIEKVINMVLLVGIPVIVLSIIYTGFLFVKAQGNSEQITKAKSALMYVLIGAVLLLGAFVIAQAIGATVDEIKKSA